MIDILWHGRGGQGAFTAARLLGAAACVSGKYALAFPSFGPERRGAPMRAFTKIADAPVGDRSAVSQADYVIYLDDTLFGEGWEDELKPGGMVLVNSVRAFDDPRVVSIDANGISAEILGRPIPNTVFLGALTVLSDAVAEGDVIKAIHQYMPTKLHAKNEKIVEVAREALLSDPLMAGDECHPERSEGSFSGSVKDSSSPLAPQNDTRGSGPRDDTGEGSASAAAPDKTTRPVDNIRIPLLRGDQENPPSLAPEAFARNTCYAAGHLVSKNAGWRNERPVIDYDKCTNCLQCYLYCPDGTIYKTPAGTQPGDDAKGPSPSLSVDYDFCKGCGICVKACKFGALSMISESEANAR